MAEPTYVPSTPDPQLVTLVMSLLRWIFTLLSAAGVTWAATTSASTLQAVSVALVGVGGAVVTLGWSIWEKYQAARADHLGSVKSAETRVATKAA